MTGEDLATEGVLVELCDEETHERDPIASGTIPGDLTLQLLRRSGSTGEADTNGLVGFAATPNGGVDAEVGVIIELQSGSVPCSLLREVATFAHSP